MNTELQKKIMDAFIGKVVRKDLAFLVRGNLPVLHHLAVLPCKKPQRLIKKCKKIWIIHFFILSL